MDVILETKKRLDIANDFRDSLNNIVTGIMLGGSMGFGQNYSIKETSDIDMVLVIEKNNLDDLLEEKFFKNKVNPKIIDLFKKGIINLFWVTNYINDIEINSFVYEKKGFEDFCLLNGELNIFVQKKPSSLQSGYSFEGKKITFNRKVDVFEDGYIYEKPKLANGKYWGGVPKQDFFYSSQILCEKDNFLTHLESRVWKSAIKQLIKEYGKNVDLNKYNVLNTHFSYQTDKDRIPPEVIKKIKSRTLQELNFFLR